MSDLFSSFNDFTKAVSKTLNSYEVRKIGDKVQGYVLNFTEVELKVREATNEDPWGPTGPQMQEIAQLTFQYDAFPEIMSMIWKRMLQDNKLAWRRVYKSLILLNNLLKTGSERVISNAKDHLFEMRALESYSCTDERGRDQGVNIRHRVKQIIELLQDDELLMEERRKTRSENKEKYQGFSKEDMMMKGGNGSSKMSNFDSWKEDKFKASSKSNDFDFPETRRDREVSSYDFDQNRSASPDLGIPDNSQKNHRSNDDDDGFGDFADARSSSQKNNSTTKSADTDLFGDFSSSSANNDFPNSRLPKPPSVPSSPTKTNSHFSPTQQNTHEGNLFDLDSDPHPVAAAVPSNNSNSFDFFSSPSAPSAPTQHNNHSVDLFGDFSDSTSVPTSTPAVAPKPSNDFDIFGDFNGGSTIPVSNSTPAMSDWGSLATPTPAPQQSVQNTIPEAKLDDGWSLLEKQLDGLTFKGKKQAAPSMNEMRTTKN